MKLLSGARAASCLDMKAKSSDQFRTRLRFRGIGVHRGTFRVFQIFRAFAIGISW